MNSDLKRSRLSIAVVTEHPRIFLIISLLIACIFISFVRFIKTEDNVDYLTLEDDPDVKFYDEFKEVFGNDEFFIIAFEKKDLFTEKNLSLLKNITEELENIDEIEEVTSLANVDDTVGSRDYFEVRKFLEDIPHEKNALDEIRRQAINNPLYVGNLISGDARTAAIIVQAYDRPNDKNYRTRLINKCQMVLDHYRKEVDTFYLAGKTTTNITLSQYMKKDVSTFIPITYILITLAIWLVFRNLRLTILAIINISLCVGSTMGLFGLTGITLNNVTTIIPSMVMALALCDTVHIFSHMDKQVLDEFRDKHKALASVLKKVVLPSFLTTLTTGIGFLSLAASKIPPIREFAWIASAGMLFEFVYSFFLLPPLILFLAPEKVYQEYSVRRGMTVFLCGINEMVQRHNGLIVMASCIMVLAAIWFITDLRVETNLIEFFKNNSPLRTSIDFVEKKLGGVDPFDISLRAQEKDAFMEPSNLRIIEKIQQYINSLEAVDVTISFVDFLKDMNESFHNENSHYYTMPETREMVSQYLLLYDSVEIEDVINSTYDHARISIRISEHSSAEARKLINDIRTYIAPISQPGLQIRVTGTVVQLVNTIDALVKGQVYSLTLAAGVIIILMFLVLRSIAIGFLSIIPNLIPIILNFGIMGAAGIPLDTGTALIAAVALGIAVDDTIHFLCEYRIKRAERVPIPKSLKMVIFIKGRAILSSSGILCIGFGVLVLSRFVPTMNFGLLCTIVMMTAVIGDLLVLPSIMLLRKSKPEKTIAPS